MSQSVTERPVIRNPSRTVLVDGEFAGRPVVYEVQTEDWLSRKTGRYHRVWSARQRGALGWSTGRTARAALKGAAYIREGRRPPWLAAAAARAQEALR